LHPSLGAGGLPETGLFERQIDEQAAKKSELEWDYHFSTSKIRQRDPRSSWLKTATIARDVAIKNK